MNVLIIEDERKSFEYLRSLVAKVLPEAHILDQVDSVEGGISIFNSNQVIDLTFMDIQLADGLSLEIFAQTNVTCPIIFTTAYDQYAIEGFKHNGIDYLLKPIQLVDIEKAVQRYKERSKEELILKIHNMVNGLNSKKTKERFLVKKGQGLKFIESRDVASIVSEDKITFLYSKEGKRYIYNKTIEEVSKEVDQNLFFQINRGQIVCADVIQEIHPYLNQRLKLRMATGIPGEYIVSRQRGSEFKAWLDT